MQMKLEDLIGEREIFSPRKANNLKIASTHHLLLLVES